MSAILARFTKRTVVFWVLACNVASIVVEIATGVSCTESIPLYSYSVQDVSLVVCLELIMAVSGFAECYVVKKLAS